MAQMEFPVIDLQATGRRIKEVREKKGITVKTLQMFLGFNEPVSIYKWQRGECLPTFDNMYAMACLFGVGIDDLRVGNRQEVVFFCTFVSGDGGDRYLRPPRGHFSPVFAKTPKRGQAPPSPSGPFFTGFCQNPQKGTGTSVPFKYLINGGSVLQLYLCVSIDLS